MWSHIPNGLHRGSIIFSLQRQLIYLYRIMMLQEQTRHSILSQSKHVDHKLRVLLFVIGWSSIAQPIPAEGSVWSFFFLERHCTMPNAIQPVALPVMLVRGILKQYQLSSLGLQGGAALCNSSSSFNLILSGPFIFPVSLYPFFTYLDDSKRYMVGFFIKNIQYHNRFGIYVINNSP